MFELKAFSCFPNQCDFIWVICKPHFKSIWMDFTLCITVTIVILCYSICRHFLTFNYGVFEFVFCYSSLNRRFC